MQMSHHRHTAIAARLSLLFHPKKHVTAATTRSMNLAGKQRHSSNHPLNESGAKSCLTATLLPRFQGKSSSKGGHCCHMF
jgi:hypothetical protein